MKPSEERFESRAIEGIGASTVSFEASSSLESDEAITVKLIVDPLIPVPLFEVEEEVSTTAEWSPVLVEEASSEESEEESTTIEW